MKGTIASLVLIALELTLCLVSSRWGSIEINDNEICFKNIFVRYNASELQHKHLYLGPMYSTRILKVNNKPEHLPSDHGKKEIVLIITGISLIIISAITFSLIEFCLTESFVDQYRVWLHLVNFVLLTISFVLMIIGFYSLQHILKHPLHGAAAIGFFIGMLFMVVLATYSAITFWTDIWQIRHKNEKIEKVEL